MAKSKNIELPTGLSIRRHLDRNPKIFLSYSSLDWYKLTESTRHVLNTVITSSAKKQLEERRKPHPNQAKIDELKQLSLTVAEISRDPKNFDSKKRMQEILEAYAQVEII